MKKWVILILSAIILSTSCKEYRNNGREVTYHYWNEGSGHHTVIIDADPATFKVLGKGYAKDHIHAFYDGCVIDQANGRSFKIIDKGYAKDTRHVFYYGNIVEGADPDSFHKVKGHLFEDKNDYYWTGYGLKVHDKASFVVIGDENNFLTSWGKDKSHYYYFPDKVCGSHKDFNSLHPIKSYMPIGGYSAYASDKFSVYFKDSVVIGADPLTFREVDLNIGQDKYQVYDGCRPTGIKDFSKLKRIGYSFYNDGDRIYDLHFKENPIVEAATFKHLGQAWFADKNNVFWYNVLVKSADVESFRPVNCYTYSFKTGIRDTISTSHDYGKDIYHVFHKDSIIQGADPETFEIVDLNTGDGWTILDKNRIYQGKDSVRIEEYRNRTVK